MKTFPRSLKTTNNLAGKPGLSLAACCALLVPHFAKAEHFMVLNTNDSGTGSLREAVQRANTMPGTDAIDFSSEVQGTITLSSGELSIIESLILDGPNSANVTINGNGTSRIFGIYGDATEVSIDDLTLTNGHAEGAGEVDGFGGAILHYGKSLLVANVEFSGNQAIGTAYYYGVGGALANFGTVTIAGCRFTGNLAAGANLYALGGAVFNANIAIIAASQFTQNQAVGGNDGESGSGFGGGVWNGGYVNISGSTLTHNGAFGGDHNYSESIPFVGLAWGGAINNSGYLGGGTMVMDDCVLLQNQAVAGAKNTGGPGIDAGGAGGAGIANGFGGSASVSNSTIENNRVIGGDDANTLTGGSAYGSGIDNFAGSKLTLNHCVIRRNQGFAGNRSSRSEAVGGGISNSGGSELTIDDSNISNNRVKGGKGALDADGGAGSGGGIANLNSLLSFLGQETKVARNHADGAGKKGIDGEGRGGGIYNSPSGNLDPSNTVPDVFGNHASDEGDDLFGLTLP